MLEAPATHLGGFSYFRRKGASPLNALDRIIKRERKLRYKRLTKLFIARGMASKHLKLTIKISDLDKHFRKDEHNHFFVGDLAKYIVDNYKKILNIYPRPPRPVGMKK